MARKLDYRWHLRQVMAARGMFATTDLIEPIAAATPSAKKRTADGADAGVGSLRPRRARISGIES